MINMDLAQPFSWEVSTAIVSGAVSLILAAISGIWNVRVYSRQQNAKTWLRFHEICAILYNRDHQHGAWQQLVAAHELEKLNIKKCAKKELAITMIDHWNGRANERLIKQLKLISNK